MDYPALGPVMTESICRLVKRLEYETEWIRRTALGQVESILRHGSSEYMNKRRREHSSIHPFGVYITALNGSAKGSFLFVYE